MKLGESGSSLAALLCTRSTFLSSFVDFRSRIESLALLSNFCLRCSVDPRIDSYSVFIAIVKDQTPRTKEQKPKNKITILFTTIILVTIVLLTYLSYWSVMNASKTFRFRSSCLVAFRISESKSSFDVRIRGLIRFWFSVPNGMDQTLRPKNQRTET